jgi:hypothetical protein
MDTLPLADVDMTALDVILGLVATAAGTARTAVHVARPVTALVLHPPFLPDRMRPQTWLEAAAQAGRHVRAQAGPVFDKFAPPVVDAVLNRIDMNKIVAKVDLDAIVARIDITAMARQVIDDIDLPEIIRESSATMASEGVLGMRMQGIDADERVNRMVDKILLRRNARKTQLRVPADGGSAEGGDETAE